MADQREQASGVANIIDIMSEMNRGNFIIECGRQLQEAKDAIVRTGKSAKLTITLEIIPAGMRDGRINQLEIKPSVTIKEPQESQGAWIFFVSEDGRISRNDPQQEILNFEKEQSDANRS